MEENPKKRLSNEEIKARILEGMALATKKLLEKAKKEDFYLTLYNNGKMTKVKARDIEF
jgi:hypothetical protein